MTKKGVLLCLGFLLGGIFLVIALQRIEWDLLKESVSSIQFSRLGIVWGFLLLAVSCRTLRWNVIAGCELKDIHSFWRAVNLGYLGNMILPARAGEVMRVAAIHRWAKIPPGAAIGSAVIDRIFDGLTMAIFLVVVVSYHGRHTVGILPMVVLASLFVAIACTVFFFIIWGDRVPFLLRQFTSRTIFAVRIGDWYQQAFVNSQALRRPSGIFLVVLLSLVAYSCDALMLWFLLFAFGWGLPFTAALTLIVFLTAGSALPAAPGYVGTYQVACIFALQLYSVGASQAVAFSVVFQLILITNFLFWGGIALWQGRQNAALVH